MKQLAKSLLLFLLTLPLSWVLLIILASQTQTTFTAFIGAQTNWGAVHDRMTEWHNNPELRATRDVLFFGSSTCYSDIDPRALEPHGLRGFNFCSSSQALGNSAALLPAALAECSPSLVVLDVYPSIWSLSVSVESSRDWALNSPHETPSWARATLNNAANSLDPFNVLLSASQWLNQAVNFHSHQAPADPNGRYEGLGYVARTFPALTETPACPADSNRVFTDDLCEVLEDVKALCKVHDAKLVLVNPPQLCPESFVEPDCWDGVDFIDGMAWPERGVAQHYYDDHHLVAEGAERYSAWLAKEIARLAPKVQRE